VCDEAGTYDPGHVTATATARGEDLELTGRKRFVMCADGVDEIAVLVRNTSDDAVAVAVVPADLVRVTPVDAIDATRTYCDVDLSGVTIPVERLLRGDGVGRALLEATVAIAMETVGVAQSVFDVTLEYAKQREQFGVPIGSFQAIKHKFADMLVALERARALCYLGALCVAEADDRAPTAVSAAKAAAGDCQRLLAKEGIQLHGGIGFTWEHDMHLYAKRLKANEASFGTAAWHRARIADLLGV
jgi:alkylation response protein AidB-like acyl-CoA dehydrogenase